MNTKVTTLAALILSVLLSNVQEVAAQTNSPPSATATRPAKTPPEQTSIPSASPPATQTTGESNQDAMVKKMNEDEKQKVDTKANSLNVDQLSAISSPHFLREFVGLP